MGVFAAAWLAAFGTNAHGDAAVPRHSVPLAIGVQGERLVDGRGATLRLVGVNHSGSEYACVHGRGVFASPADASVATAIATWRANVVRIPLNESCWLGSPQIPASTSGPSYRTRIVEFVRVLHARGLYVILELHWSRPGLGRAVGQQAMPDVDHSLAFWRSVATTFRDDRAVVFDVFNEPFVDQVTRSDADAWRCWRDGCSVVDRSGHARWRAVGMQALVDEIRRTGARQPIALGGLDWAHDLRGWNTYAPDDPARALIVSFHTYAGERCDDEACWNASVAPLARVTPVIATEIGESGRGHAYIDRFMAWADAHAISYLAWTWNAWRGSPFALVADWRGQPASAYGRAFRDHLASLHEAESSAAR